MSATLDGIRAEDLEFHDLGDTIFTTARLIGLGRGSGAEFDQAVAFVSRVRDGQMVYQRTYGDRDEAARDAGL